MQQPRLFIPHALARPYIKREGRVTRDLTMPPRDWSQYDRPTYQRKRKVKQ